MRRSSSEETLPEQAADTQTQPTVILNLVDYDGCFRYISAPPPEDTTAKQNEWVEQQHPLLLSYLEKQIALLSPNRVIFGLGTNRQDYHVDTHKKTKNNNGSCVTSPLFLQQYFRQFYLSGIYFDPFMMADIYHQHLTTAVTSGTSYTNIYLDSPIETHARAPFDDNKISLIYAHAHRVAALNPETKITINFFDSKENIIVAIMDFFSKHTDLLPNNVKLFFCLYNGEKFATTRTTPDDIYFIQGTGDLIDKNYDWSIRLMAACSAMEFGPSNAKPSVDPSSLLAAAPKKIDPSTYFKFEKNKVDFISAREIMQTWTSRISADGYKTAYEFKRIYKIPTKLRQHSAFESIAPRQQPLAPENNQFDRHQEMPFFLMPQPAAAALHSPREEPTASAAGSDSIQMNLSGVIGHEEPADLAQLDAPMGADDCLQQQRVNNESGDIRQDGSGGASNSGDNTPNQEAAPSEPAPIAQPHAEDGNANVGGTDVNDSAPIGRAIPEQPISASQNRYALHNEAQLPPPTERVMPNKKCGWFC